jgi:hypothetical protein
MNTAWRVSGRKKVLVRDIVTGSGTSRIGMWMVELEWNKALPGAWNMMHAGKS